MKTQISGPVAVVGDLHGQADKLARLLDKLRQLPAFEQRWVVFIGDFVDRGPQPKLALDIVTEFAVEHDRTTAVCGNHDLAMAAALNWHAGPRYQDWRECWMSGYDAEVTFRSYGAEFGDYEALAAGIPRSHQEFLTGLPWCVQHPEYLFVHAGLDPNIPFETQRRILASRDFSLNRPPWLCSKSLVRAQPPADCSYCVVSGHSYVPAVELTRRRVLVDTTGGETGELSCALLPERTVLTSAAGEAPSASKWKFWAA